MFTDLIISICRDIAILGACAVIWYVAGFISYVLILKIMAKNHDLKKALKNRNKMIEKLFEVLRQR